MTPIVITDYELSTHRGPTGSQVKLTSVGWWVVPILIISALFQNYYDLESVMSGEFLKLNQAQGPIAIRAMKDFSYIVIFTAALTYISRNMQIHFGIPFMFMVILCIVLFFLSLQNHGLLTAGLGLRWALPLLIFMALKDWSWRFDGDRALKWIYAGLLICLLAQIYQLFNMPPIYGTIFGLSARTPGIFLAPNTTSFFGCSCAAFLMVFGKGNAKHTVAGGVLAVVISMLAQSGTGIVVSAFLLLHSFLTRSPAISLMAGGLAMSVILPNLDRFLSRDGVAEISGGGRLERLSEISAEAAFTINNFGFYTNAINLANEAGKYRLAVDSLVASFIGNFGITAVLALLLLTIFCVKEFKGVRFEVLLPPLMVFSVFSLTTIVFEAYPMNILLAISFWGVRNAAFENRTNLHA